MSENAKCCPTAVWARYQIPELQPTNRPRNCGKFLCRRRTDKASTNAVSNTDKSDSVKSPLLSSFVVGPPGDLRLLSWVKQFMWHGH